MSVPDVRGLAEDKYVKYVKAVLTKKEQMLFSETEIEELKAWLQQTRVYDKFETEIAPHILNQALLKKLSGYALFAVQKPIYVLCVADPAVAKSQIALWIQERTPNTMFIEGTKLTGAGLTMSRMGKIITLGALPQTHNGTLFLDELDKTPISEAVALYSSMANHEFSIQKANLQISHCPSKQSGVFFCNPKGEHFITKHPDIIKSQIPFKSTAFLTRFHAVLCLFQYDIIEFEAITRHQYKATLGRIHTSVIDSNLEMWKRYVEYARKYKIEWTSTKKMEDIITIFATEVFRQQEHLALPVSARLNEGIIGFAEAVARSMIEPKVMVKHVVKAIMLMLECFKLIGLDERPVLEQLKNYGKEK